MASSIGLRSVRCTFSIRANSAASRSDSSREESVIADGMKAAQITLRDDIIFEPYNLSLGQAVEVPGYITEHFARASTVLGYKIDPPEILVMLDDMALPLGRLRLRLGGGSGGHNGLESVIVQFATEGIPRLRIGIGEAPAAGSVDYVLSRFFEEEKPIVRSTIDRAAAAVKCAIDNDLISAMNIFNKTEEP